MVPFPFVGGGYSSRSRFFDASRTINLYPEIGEGGSSKSISMLVGTPGLKLWVAVGTGPIRGMLRFTKDIAIIASGSSVYKVTPGAVVTLIGSINLGTSPVTMASNGTTVMVACGAVGYFVNPIAMTVTQISDSDFAGADTVGYCDGFFVFNKPGTGQFQISSAYSTDIPALDFATAEGAPDLLKSLLIDHREVWLFGETSTEVFFNSGNSDFPFERIQGAFIEQGIAAKFSAAKMDNTVYWLSADDRGQGMVQRATGYQPQRVSTHAVEYAISKYSTIDDAIGYTYQQEGHSFYVLVFPTAQATWCFDAASGEWHERLWRDPATGDWGRHRSNCHIAFAGENIVGDWQSGNLYQLDLDTYTDNGDPLVAVRQTPYLSNGNLYTFFHRLWVDMEVGVGTQSGQGYDPMLMLEWSDDGGNTWKNQQWCKVGKVGERTVRAMFRRLGKSRARVFRVSLSDPVKRIFIQAAVDSEVGMT